MAAKPQIKQLNVEVTQSVKGRLKRLERDLVHHRASPPEIVAVLINTASAKKFSAKALEAYRKEAARARR